MISCVETAPFTTFSMSPQWISVLSGGVQVWRNDTQEEGESGGSLITGKRTFGTGALETGEAYRSR